ncbi:DNA alkylation repair protein [Pontibacter oryzae]|uniref:DNA alkylation repair protein n=1 Tax=Pontibacter oryzae TaxID=2304593 RepID=A0A399SIW3_9BACT|nr:DNA alkylation repair protein [Pontibacter oryzae]RIJ42891.1 DNA alkylation repair protein [Pontibacter oryzae]
MTLSLQAKAIYAQILQGTTKLGDLRNIAKEIKKDHALAMQLWSIGKFYPRQLAILIMDKKLLNQEAIDELCNDIQNHEAEERNQLIDWMMANQLSKDKKTIALMESWEKSASPLQRRLFWYYQARLRWMGNTNHSNTEYLLTSIEDNLLKEEPEVQWAMNYTAGQIGKWQEEYRNRCILIGERTGLYKDEVVAKNCTPSYLPKFISIEVAKLQKQ